MTVASQNLPATTSGTLDTYPTDLWTTLATLTGQWLDNRKLSHHTRRAYAADVADWLTWCQASEVHPFAARFTHLNAYARHLETTPTAKTSRPLGKASRARRLSAIGSWFDFCRKLGATASNPVADADRPKVSQDASATVGLTASEAGALFAQAQADPHPQAVRTAAIVGVLLMCGLRVGELTGLDCESLTHDRGHRALVFTGKGDKRRKVAVPPAVLAVLDTYLTARAQDKGCPASELSGPLFVTATGRRLDQGHVWKIVRRVARDASIPAWDRLSPHSLRHTVATLALDSGAELRDVQDLMGHADPRTTRRYDLDRQNLDRSPVYAVAALLTGR